MLKIKSLKLTNVGRHKKIDERFDGHVIGLTGPNGLGKTTLLQSLQFCFSGTIDTENKEALQTFIRQSECENPPKFAEVESEFEADGREGRIIRRITPRGSTRKLFWDGEEKPLTKEKEVAAVMEDLLGIDREALNSTVFIRQGEMDAMFKSETKRRDFYMRLMMLNDMPKIANIVETHRAHIADTVQDLGVKKDTLEAAYREASEYFTSVDEALSQHTDVSEKIATVRHIIGAFNAQEEAEHDVTQALAQLKDGAVSSKEVKELSEKLTLARESRDKLETKYRANVTASKALADSERDLAVLREDMVKFQELQEEKEKLAGMAVSESPAADLSKVEGKLEEFLILGELEREVPQLQATQKEKEDELKPLKAKASDLHERYQGARDDWSEANGLLKVAKDTLNMVVSAKHTITECPVCLSTAPPEKEKIEQSIAKMTEKLTTLQQKGETLQRDCIAAKDAQNVASNEVAAARQRAAEAGKKLMQLRLSLSTSSKEDLEKRCEELTIAFEKWNESAILRRSQSERVKSLEQRILDSGRESPTQNKIQQAEIKVEQLTESVNLRPWTEADEEDLSENKEFIAANQGNVDRWSEALKSLQAAEKRSETAKKTLNEAFNALSEEDRVLFKPEDNSALITAAAAQKSLERLESTQAEFNEAKGRKDAANERLKDASSNLVELETQIAEQKHRLELADDLASIRDVFKPNGASMDYLNYKFGEIAELAADYLAVSGADFMVAPSDSIPLSYDFLRTDRENESWLTQNKLSGGQKVRLAVATLRAIHETVIPNLGLLVLDEPTTHLDDEVKVAMADMLRKIGEEETLQIFVCDHSPILVDSFSDIIDLQKYE